MWYLQAKYEPIWVVFEVCMSTHGTVYYSPLTRSQFFKDPNQAHALSQSYVNFVLLSGNGVETEIASVGWVCSVITDSGACQKWLLEL